MAIVCRASDEEKASLNLNARKAGLPAGALVFTRYVSDTDLVALYNTCKAFIFPSCYENFGLPVLEAMRCGAPVIGSNASSIPEVIGNDEALFDPHSTQDMARMMEKLLTDDEFCRDLRKHAVAHAENFSWDKTAEKALSAMRKLEASRAAPSVATPEKPRLAFVSPLPPERSGISFYSAELLPHLSNYYDIDLIIQQADVDLGADGDLYALRDLTWFEHNGAQFDRVLYQFGNSDFHSHMYDLLDKFPGTIVLHDFFMSENQRHMNTVGFVRSLAEDSGFVSVLDCLGTGGSYEKAIELWPTNGRVLRAAEGVIVHSQHSRDLAQKYLGAQADDDFTDIPLLRTPAEVSADARAHARKALGIAPDALLICSFGHLSLNKQVLELIDGFALSAAAKNLDAALVFVGEGASIQQMIDERLAANLVEKQVTITGWTSDETYQAYLLAADIAVQLRTRSRGESSAAVLDVQNYGIATIVNAHGSLADLPDGSVLSIPDAFTATELAGAIDTLATDPARRDQIGSFGREIITTKHTPEACAAQYRNAIEHFYHCNGAVLGDLYKKLARLPSNLARDTDVAQAVIDCFPSRPRLPQLFVDVSMLAEADSHSGIQRVVRAILTKILHAPPSGWRVEPVYMDKKARRFRYARDFTCRFLDIPTDWAVDDPIDFAAGDHFVGLDLNFEATPDMLGPLEFMAAAGVEISFVIYDLLPVRQPQHFTSQFGVNFKKWLELLSTVDRVVCISKSVTDDFGVWMTQNNVSPLLAPDVRWFHLGADVSNSVRTKGLPRDASKVLAQLKTRPTFVMVGTIEPRKGYDQVLAAFEQLWADGTEANFVIVGKPGWNVDKFVKELRSHKQKRKKLFWLSTISDEYLEEIYAASDCLISASHGEGFGLPLIEAARHKLPVLVRNLPFFQEVAGQHAAYFDGDTPQSLAQAITDWMSRRTEGRTIPSDEMPWSTWEASTRKFLEALDLSAPDDSVQ